MGGRVLKPPSFPSQREFMALSHIRRGAGVPEILVGATSQAIIMKIGYSYDNDG